MSRLSGFPRTLVWRTTFLVLLLLPVVAVHGATVEDRLAALEEKMAALAAENARLRSEVERLKTGEAGASESPALAPSSPPPAATPAPVASVAPAAQTGASTPTYVRAAGKEERFTLGGFIQVFAETSGEPDARYSGLDARFHLRRARVNFTTRFTEDITAKIEADFGANSMAASSGVRAQMTDGFIQWSRYPAATVRIGQFKTPFGFEQLVSDTKLLTTERALSNDSLTVGRQIGVALSGDIANDRLAYTLGVFNGNGVNTGRNDNQDYMVAGRLHGTLLETEIGGVEFSWKAGANAFTVDYSGTMPSTREGLGFDSQIRFGPAELRAEWLQNRREPLGEDAFRSEGWSLLAAWDLSAQWRAVVRFDTYSADTRLSASDTDGWTFGLDYRLKGDDLKISVNYLWGDRPAPFDDDGRLVGRFQAVF